MIREKDLIKLEKDIKIKINNIKLGKIKKSESGIGRSLNLMKTFDEVLYESLLSEYKKISDIIK